MLDTNIRGFFDAIDHEWLVKFVEHRVGDERILRLIHKWLNAGVMENGEWARSEVGSPQGATVSPLLANVYLHHVLDLWVQQWRKLQARGEVIIVRYADDFIVGFQHRTDAEWFRVELHHALDRFPTTVARRWHHSLRRRNQRSRLDWNRMRRVVARWLPSATIVHPWPSQRFRVRTRGKSPVR